MNNPEQLKSLRELGNYEVSREDPDVRGWTVISTDGQRMGTVSDLMVDTNRMKVEYLSVAGDGGSGSPMMIPVASAQLDRAQREVIVAGPMSGASTAYAGDTSSASRGTSTGAMSEGRDRTSLTRAEEELRIGKRQVSAGEVVVGKHVETERVSEPVTVERERVRIERRPVTEATMGAADIGSGEIRVPVMEEEVIVDKRPVVREELVISKERVQETETVDTEVRREEFDVRSTPDGLVDDTSNPSRRRR
jgi:uncharacterized protein (TIGR02271 family)